MKLLVDENLPPRLAHALQALFEGQHEIVHARDRWGPRVTDLEWIPNLGAERGWSVLSGDRRITKNAAERRAFLAAGLTGFFYAKAFDKERRG